MGFTAPPPPPPSPFRNAVSGPEFEQQQRLIRRDLEQGLEEMRSQKGLMSLTDIVVNHTAVCGLLFIGDQET